MNYDPLTALEWLLQLVAFSLGDSAHDFRLFESRNQESVLLVLQSSMIMIHKTVAMRQIRVSQAIILLNFLPYSLLAYYLADSNINTMYNTNPSCFSDLSNKVCKLRESFLTGFLFNKY